MGSVSIGVIAQVALVGMLCLDLSADRAVVEEGGQLGTAVAYYQAGPALLYARAGLFALAFLDMLRTFGVYHHMMPAFGCFGVWAWLEFVAVPPYVEAALGAEAGSAGQAKALANAAALRVPALWLAAFCWPLVMYSQAKGAVRAEYPLLGLVLGLSLQGLVLEAAALASPGDAKALAAAVANVAAHAGTFVNAWLVPAVIAALALLAVRRVLSSSRTALDTAVLLVVAAAAPFHVFALGPAEKTLAGAGAAATADMVQAVAVGHVILAASALAAVVLHRGAEAAVAASAPAKASKQKKRQ